MGRLPASLDMKLVRTCPKCGANVRPNSPEGLCPRCLVHDALCDSRDPLDEAGSGKETQLGGPRCLGDYELLDEIARGGMGVVYRARQRSLDRIVAVKMILFGAVASPAHVQRFRREAATAGSLKHPGIVAVHEVGLIDGQPFLAMDYVAGPDFSQLVKGGPLPARRAASYLREIAEAVHHAHQCGVLHRDLKPSNILLGPDNRPLVTDFGLAKRVGADSIDSLSGQVVGSPNYMPPELCAMELGDDGHDIALGSELEPPGQTGEVRTIPLASPRHRRSPPPARSGDIYSLGAVLYHLLTGRPPFAAATLVGVLRQVQESEPARPSMLNPSIPRDLETICLKCLEKEPSRRYHTVEELGEELGRFLNDEPILARPVSHAERVWRWCRRKPAFAATIALSFLLLLTLSIGSPIAAYRISRSRNEAVSNELKARRAQYASDMNLAQQAMRDGDFFRALQLLERHRPSRKMVGDGLGLNRGAKFERSGDQPIPYPSNSLPTDHISSTTDLRGWEWYYIWQQCQGEEKFVLGTHTNGVNTVGFLPDGKTAYSAGWDGKVKLWNLESRKETARIVQDNGIVVATVSPDGEHMVTATSTSAIEDGFPVQVWNLKNQTRISTLVSNHWPRPSMAYSPDGRYLAIAGVRRLDLWDVRNHRVLTNWPYGPSVLGTRGVAFSPNSELLAINHESHGRIKLVAVDSLATVGEFQGHTNEVLALAFSPSGQLLVSGSGDGTLRLWDIPQRRMITNRYLGDAPVCFSFAPDGKTVAAALDSRQRAMIFDASNAQTIRELIGHANVVTAIAYSPDGTQLLTGSLDGTVRVWDGFTKPKPEDDLRLSDIAYWNAYGWAEALSANGQHAFGVFTNGTFSIWTIASLRVTTPLGLPLTNVTLGAISPGGDLVAFCREGREVHLWNSHNHQARLLTSAATNRGVARLAFSSDGKRLASAGSGVWVWDLSSTEGWRTIDDKVDRATVMEMVFADRDRQLLVGCYDGEIRVYSLDSTGRKSVLRGHKEQVRGLALHPDRRTLFSVSGDGLLCVWDVPNQTEIARLNPRTVRYFCAALSPDGRRLAAGAGDGIVTIWDTTSFQEVAQLKAHLGRVQRVSFTSDGDTLVSIGKDSLRVWRATPYRQAEKTSLP